MIVSKENILQLEFDVIKTIVRSYLHSNLSQSIFENEIIITDFNLLNELNEKVYEFLKLLKTEDNFYFQNFNDITSLIKLLEIENSQLQSAHYLDILKLIDLGSYLTHFFKNKMEMYPNLFRIISKLNDLSQIKKNINQTIDETGLVLDTASPELNSIRRELSKVQTQIFSKTQELTKNKYKEFVLQEIMTIKNDRHVLAVKIEHGNMVEGVVHGFSNSGNVIYIEPQENIKLSAKFETLIYNETKEIDKILKNLSKQIRPYCEFLYQNLVTITNFDILYAKSNYGKVYNCIIPKLKNDKQEIKLISAFHPILLKTVKKENNIPVNITFGEAKNKFILISGPNAGGKTVTLKCVGLAVLMFQSGIPIPCAEGSYLPIFHKLFCDIGDKQSIQNDLSTFTSHLKSINDMLKNSSVDTLLLIDELGTGTDPYEGAALAKMFLQQFLKLGVCGIATTHLSELKIFANSIPGIENASMEFDEEKLHSTYRLIQGIPGKSYAFEISKRLGISEFLIDLAKLTLDSNKVAVEKLISDLNKQLNETNKLRNDLDLNLSRTKSLEIMFNRKLEKLKDDELDLKKNQIQQLQELIGNANKQIERAISDIKKNDANKESTNNAREIIKSISTIKDQKNKEIVTHQSAKNNFNIGDQVRINDLNTIGEIITIGNKKAKILIGNIQTEIELNRIKFLEKKKISKADILYTVDFSNSNLKNIIDLRGFDFEDAWIKCDEFISYSQFSDWNEFTILHGKGNGILKDKINEKLKFDKRILSKRFGYPNEGDTGVTIISVKKK